MSRGLRPLAQHAWLRLAKKMGLHGANARLFHPPCELLWSDALPGQYEEIFIREDYAPRVPLPARPRILDLGAYLGLAAMYFLWRYPDCRLTCVEPNPHSFAPMEKAVTAVARRTGAEVAVINAAVGATDGMAMLEVDADTPVNVAANVTGRMESQWQQATLPVEVIDLRRLIGPGVDYLKMDIEGMEFPVFEANIITPDTVKAFAVELHDIDRRKDRVRAIAENLARMGYGAADWRNRALAAADIAALDGCQVIRFHVRD